MPRRRKSFGRRKSRKGRRTRKGRRMAGRKGMSRATTTIARGPSGFPDRLFVKLNYSDTYAFTTTLGIATQQVFRGNSVFDPDQTGVGHQPYAFDQWANFYGYYRVHGSKIRAQLCSQSASGANFSTFTPWLAVFPSLSTAAPSYPNPLQEMPYVSYRYPIVYGQGNRENIINKYMSTAKIFGEKKLAVETEDNFSAAVTTNPADIWYWHAIVGSLDNASTQTAIVIFKITYYVEFSARKDMAGS